MGKKDEDVTWSALFLVVLFVSARNWFKLRSRSCSRRLQVSPWSLSRRLGGSGALVSAPSSSRSSCRTLSSGEPTREEWKGDDNGAVVSESVSSGFPDDIKAKILRACQVSRVSLKPCLVLWQRELQRWCLQEQQSHSTRHCTALPARQSTLKPAYNILHFK